MVLLFSTTLVTLAFLCRCEAYMKFDVAGCHVYRSTGMCGSCVGGCWPYWSNENNTCGFCRRCQPCPGGRLMDELCRCTEECPLGKFGDDCIQSCPYKCRACDRHTGTCLLWCSELCIDGCQLSTGFCRYNTSKLTSCRDTTSPVEQICPEYSDYVPRIYLR
ncbi:keratin-associated protein 5-5-like [Dreissena polymorpha]|uniref:TNFR-Cys domain-containing protein n=1 Tax=Dreissena polymorpha TaxID=45954 RepID=A0A9D4H1P3_DREPO|nr:keratin-associated protein 5-5-like [Dreissena polymorpha]XP_052285793.1 keratin-associated protein 5-5-like [Dreissena polymorpha]KAH3827776.1 hypothetical protein DPMN_129718 [Dreissena polymorpha]